MEGIAPGAGVRSATRRLPAGAGQAASTPRRVRTTGAGPGCRRRWRDCGFAARATSAPGCGKKGAGQTAARQAGRPAGVRSGAAIPFEQGGRHAGEPFGAGGPLVRGSSPGTRVAHIETLRQIPQHGTASPGSAGSGSIRTSTPVGVEQDPARVGDQAVADCSPRREWARPAPWRRLAAPCAAPRRSRACPRARSGSAARPAPSLGARAQPGPSPDRDRLRFRAVAADGPARAPRSGAGLPVPSVMRRRLARRNEMRGEDTGKAGGFIGGRIVTRASPEHDAGSCRPPRDGWRRLPFFAEWAAF